MVNLVNNSETLRTIQQDLAVMRLNLKSDAAPPPHGELLELLSQLYELFHHKVAARQARPAA